MPKKPPKRNLALAGMGGQLVVTIFVGAFLGKYLDENYPISDRKVFTLILTLLFTGVATFNIIRQLNRDE